jgi:hypothetical protein
MKTALLNEALRIANRSLHTHPEYDHYCHWAFIIQNNSLVEYGTNDSGIPPIHLGYNERVSWSNAKRHAEFNAYRRAKGLLIPNKSFECINVRLNRNNQIKLSAPCSCCGNFLKDSGCSHVHFTTDFGWAKIKL